MKVPRLGKYARSGDSKAPRAPRLGSKARGAKDTPLGDPVDFAREGGVLDVNSNKIDSGPE